MVSTTEKASPPLRTSALEKRAKTLKRQLTKEQKIEFLRTMMRIRALEETIHQMYLNSELFGMSPHLSCGEEAIAVGVCKSLRKGDYMLTTHRGHGHTLAMGADPKRMLAELCGKATGYCKGKGGTMHIADVNLGILGANGIVGGGIPIASGVGLSIKIRKTDQVCICFFGDAAANEGAFHEAVNLAAAFKLPVIFVCENNLYGLSTPYENVSATPDVADRAKGYGIPGIVVNGQYIAEVYNAMHDAIERATQGEGPSILECKTYRYYGHSASDDRRYRTKDEEEHVRENLDPIMLLTREVLAENILTEDDIAKMEQEAEQEAQAAKEFTLSSPEPDVSTLLDDVYA